jgi:hypothetical protein
LFHIPSFEEPYLTVKNRSISFLRPHSLSLSQLLATNQDLSDGVEDFLDGVEPIRCKIAHDVVLIWTRLVVALEVEDPKRVEMWVHTHVKGVGGDGGVGGEWTGFVEVLKITGLAGDRGMREQKEEGEEGEEGEVGHGEGYVIIGINYILY